MLRTSDHRPSRHRAPPAARRADPTEARLREPVGALTAFLVLPFVWIGALAGLTDDRSTTPAAVTSRAPAAASRAAADSLAGASTRTPHATVRRTARPRGPTPEGR